MSDGASEGYRSAREYEARQKKIDAFFEETFLAARGERAVDSVRAAFETFDALRFQRHVSAHRLRKTVGKRWEAYRETLMDVNGENQAQEYLVLNGWAKILSMALESGSVASVERLRLVSPFRSHRIALCVPNGKRNDPTIHGDLLSALDALARYGTAFAAEIDEPERAVVGIEIGAGGKEITEPERSKLRFLAVLDRKAA